MKDNDKVMYMASDGKLYSYDKLTTGENKYTDDQINTLKPYYVGQDNKYYTKEQLKSSGYPDDYTDNLNSKQKTFDPEGTSYDYKSAQEAGLKADKTGHWPSRNPSTGQILKGQKHETYNKTVEAEAEAGYEIIKGDDGKYYSKQKSTIVDGRPVQFRESDNGELTAKHPDAKQWRPVSEFKEENPDFWNKAEQAYVDDKLDPQREEKEKKLNDYEFARKQLEDNVEKARVELLSNPSAKRGSGGKDLNDATEALEKFNERYKGIKEFKNYSKVVEKDYSGFIPEGEKKGVINAAKAAQKQNDVFVANENLSPSQKQEWTLKTKITELDDQIRSEKVEDITEENREKKQKKISDLNKKRTEANTELQIQLKASHDEREQLITELNAQLEGEEDPDVINDLTDEIKFQQSLNDAFFKAKGDPSRYQEEATKAAIKNNSDDLFSLIDVIPPEATEEEALNIYFQALISEKNDLKEELNSVNSVAAGLLTATDILFPRRATERLAEITPKINALAPIVALNKLPDRMGDNEEKSLTGNWAQQVYENTGKFLKITGKEAAKIFQPGTGHTPWAQSNKEQAIAITETIDKLGLDDAVNAIPKEILEDRRAYDRWTAGWIGERTGPTVGIMIPMAVGSFGYTKLAKISKPLQWLDKVGKTGKLTKGALATTKVTKLGKATQAVGKSLTKGTAQAIKTGFQYETGGIIFSGNEVISGEADFLSGFLGTVGEKGVMVVPKMLGKVFGNKLPAFLGLAFKFLKSASKPIGGGVGESSEEFLQSTWQIYRDTETHDEFEKQWLHQFGDRTERFDFFAHTFAMGMAFRGSAQFGEMMATESKNAYFKLTGEEKKMADQFANNYITDQVKAQRKEMIGFTSEFNDTNLSILYEDSKRFLEESKESGNKEDIQIAEEANKGYKAELNRRKISDEHATIKAQIEQTEEFKAVLMASTKKTGLNTKKGRKNAIKQLGIVTKLNKKLKSLDKQLSKSESDQAKANIDVLKYEKTSINNKISDLDRKERVELDLLNKEFAKRKEILQKKEGNEKQIEKLTHDTKLKSGYIKGGYQKQKNELNTILKSFGKYESQQQKIIDDIKIKGEEKKIKRRENGDAGIKETALYNKREKLEAELDEFNLRSQKPLDQIKEHEKEISKITKELDAFEDERKPNPTEKIKFDSKNIDKSVKEAGYESLRTDKKAELPKTKGGTSPEIKENIAEVEPAIGEVLNIVKRENTEGVKNLQGKEYKHFINIEKNGKQIGSVGYETKEEKALLKALKKGKNVKIVITKVNKYNGRPVSFSYDLVIKSEPKKEVVKKKVVEQPKTTKIETKKADIKKRIFPDEEIKSKKIQIESERQEEINSEGFRPDKKTLNQINAKYDAELATLEIETTPVKPKDISAFKSKKPTVTDAEIRSAIANQLQEQINAKLDEQIKKKPKHMGSKLSENEKDIRRSEIISINENEKHYIEIFAKAMHDLYYQQETSPSKRELINLLKDAVYSGTMGSSFEASNIIDINRTQLMKIAGLFKDTNIKGDTFELYQEEIEHTFTVSSEQRISAQRKAFLPLYKAMEDAGVKNAEQKIYDITHIDGIKEALENEQIFSDFSKTLYDTHDPVLIGLLNDRSLLDFTTLVSLIDFNSSLHLFPSIAISKPKKGSNKKTSIINISQPHDLTERTDTLIETIHDFEYEGETDADNALSKAWHDYFIGKDSKISEIRNKLDGKKRNIAIEKLYNEFLTMITGLDWSGYLNNKNSENVYYKDKSGEPRLLKALRSKITKGASHTIAYFKNPGPNGIESNIIKQGNTSNSTALRFRNVISKMKTSLEQTSNLITSLYRIPEIQNHKEYKANGIVIHLSERDLVIKRHNGSYLDKNKQVVEEMADYDIVSDLVFLFSQGEDTYLQHTGQYADKKQFYLIEVPKYPNAKKAYQNRYDTLDEKEKAYMIDPKNVKDRYGWVAEIISREDTHRNTRRGNREEFIENFLFNYALNKFDLDYITKGRPSNYKNAVDVTKRGGSTVSPGIEQNLFIEEGVGEFNEHHVVSNRMFGKNDALDGLEVAMPEWMAKKAVSIGGVFSMVGKYGKYTTVKEVHSDVIGADRILDKMNVLDIEPLALQWPESVYGKMYEYMKEYGINTMTFAGGSTKSSTDLKGKMENNTDPVNFLFNDKGEFTDVEAPKKTKRRNSNTFKQVDLRKEEKPGSSKQGVQSTANFMPFKSAEAVAQIWEDIQGRVITGMANYFGDIKSDEVDYKLLDEIDEEILSEFHKYVKNGGDPLNPYYDRITQKVRAAKLEKKILEKTVNRVSAIEVPVADIPTAESRKTKDGKHVHLPEVHINIDGIRYKSDKMTRKRAMNIIKANKDEYIDMYSVSDGSIKEWALLDAGDGNVFIPGEIVAYLNVPAEGLRNHSYARAAKPIKGAGNIIITDRKTQVQAGRDFDGDNRYAEVLFRDKDGNNIINDTSIKGLTNKVQRMIQEEFENPANYDMINEPIDIDKYDDFIDEKRKADDSLSSNDIHDVLALKEINSGSNKAIGIIQNFSTAYSFIKKHNLPFKRTKDGRKRFSLPRFNKEGKRIGGQHEVKGFSSDRFNLLNNHIGNFMNMVLDNAKDPKAKYMGINEYTAEMFMTFVVTDTSLDDTSLTREEQEKLIMDRVEAAVGFFNSPIIKRYVELKNEQKRLGNNKIDREIREQLKIEYKGKGETEYYAFNNIRKLSNEISNIFSYINLTRKFPKSTVEFNRALQNERKLRNNELSTIDVDGFFNYKKTGNDSPFISTARKSLEYAKSNIFNDTLEGSKNMQSIVDKMLSWKGRTEQYPYLSDIETDTILKKTTAILLLNIYDKGNTLSQTAKELETYIKSQNNWFTNMLTVVTKADGTVSIEIDTSYRRQAIGNELIDLIHKDFDKIPKEIREKFLFYSIGKYGISTVSGSGNFSSLFSTAFQVEIGDKIRRETERWMNNDISEAEINEISETIRMSTPSLNFELSEGRRTYNYVGKQDSYIVHGLRRHIAGSIIRRAKGEGIRTLNEVMKASYPKNAYMNSVANRIIAEAIHFGDAAKTKAENILSHAKNIASDNFGEVSEKPIIEPIQKSVEISKVTNHSGGAIGSDTQWDIIGKEFGMTKNKHYYFEGFKTPNGNTSIPISEKLQADDKLKAANETLQRRYPTSKEYVNNLLRRNWWQVKNSNAIFAISTITNNKVDGGTGWAVHMAIAENKPVYVFDQNTNEWNTWNGTLFVKTETPILTENFSGIGTRNINEAGKQAIRNVYEKSIKIDTDTDTEIKHMSEANGLEEALASSDPKLDKFVQEHFKKLFPGLKIFTSQAEYKAYVARLGGLVDNIDFNAMGSAFAHGVYINPNKAAQSTFFHENAHIYWAMLPDNHPVKKQLLELFGSEEDAVIEIGRMGIAYAKEQMNSPHWTNVKNTLRKFWIAVHKMFNSKPYQDPVLSLAIDIWNDNGSNFSHAEKLSTIEHHGSNNNLEYDDDTHRYSSAGIEFSSATQLIDKYKRDKFNPFKAAALTANKENRLRRDNNKPEMTKPERESFMDGKIAEWQLDNEIGTASHKIIELTRQGKDLPKQQTQYFTEEGLEQFNTAIEEYFGNLNAYPNSEVFEEMDADFDNYVAGTIDFQFENNEGEHIRDFKFSRTSKYDENGDLSEKYISNFRGKRLLPPLNRIEDSKKNNHAIQLNIYHKIKNNKAIDLAIIPIHFEVDENNKVIKTTFENNIPVNINKDDTTIIFEENRKSTEEIIDSAKSIKTDSGYVEKISREEEIEAITKIKQRMGENIDLKDLKTNPDVVNRLFKHSLSNPISQLEENGFDEEELSTFSLHTLLHHWHTNTSKPKDVGENYESPLPTLESFRSKYPSSSDYMRNKFENDFKKAQKIYAEIEKLTKKGNSVLNVLESLIPEQIYDYENRLRGLDDDAAGPLKVYLNRRLVREMIIDLVSKENSPNYTEYRFGTVLLAEMLESGVKTKGIDNVGMMFLNDRFVADTDKMVQYLFQQARDLNNKSHNEKKILNDDINEIYKSGKIDLNSITETVDGVKYYKEIDDSMTDAEKKLISYMETFYNKYSKRHAHIASLPGRNKPRIAISVFSHYASRTQVMEKYGVKGAAYHKYFTPVPWDRYKIDSSDDAMTFEDYKRNFEIGTDKLSDLKNAYKKAKEKYDQNIKETGKRAKEPDFVTIKNNPNSGFNKFENQKQKLVTIQGMASMLDKHFMEKTIPLFKHTQEMYNQNEKELQNMLVVIKKIGNKQIFGKSSKEKTKLRLGFDIVVTFRAMSSLFLNEMAAVANLGIGLVTNSIVGVKPDATGWKAIVPTAFYNGFYRMATNLPKVLNILREYRIVDVATEHSLDDLGLWKDRAVNVFMIYTIIVENVNQGIMFSGSMDQATWDAHGNDGKIDPAKKHLLSAQKLRVLQNINRSSAGDYGNQNHVMMNELDFGAFVMQFRNWVPTYMKLRFGSTYKDNNGIVHTSMYKALYNQIAMMVYNYATTKSYRQSQFEKTELNLKGESKFNAMTNKQMIGTLAYLKREANAGRLDFSKMPKFHQQAVGMALREFMIIGVSTVAMIKWLDDDDDKKKDKRKKTALNILINLFTLMASKRTYGDILMIYSPETWDYFFRTPSPALGWMGDVFKVVTELGKIGTAATSEYVFGNKKKPFSSFDEGKRKRQKNNTYIRYKQDTPNAKAGELKLWNKLIKVLPGGSGAKVKAMFLREWFGTDKKKRI